MHLTKAAKRYADALLDLTEETKQTEVIKKDLAGVLETIMASKELQNLLRSPIVKTYDKKEVLFSLFTGKVDKLTISFLSLITEKGRVSDLSVILLAFEHSYNLKYKIKKATVSSAFELSEIQKSELIKSFEQKTESTILATYHVDSSLKGGLKVQINDTIYDGTISHKLSRLESLFSSPL